MSKLKYSIITEIKKSDKSNVYLAAVDGYKEPVIVKEISHGNYQVFEALMEINSEYLPKIYHIDEIDEGLLVVEEYVDGELLSDILATEKLTEIECLNIVEQICAALEVLHNHKPALIHRDIKPSNIIITSKGIVKLIDYDSSRLFKEEAETDTRFLGTEKYAAPEQYGYSQTDCRSDIYSLGVVLEKFTTFLSENKKKSWNRLVEKCTLFSPDSRYQTIAEVENSIKKIKRNNDWRLKAFAGIVISCCFVGVLLYIITSSNGSKTDELYKHTTDLLDSVDKSTTDIETETAIEIDTSDSNASKEEGLDRPPEWRNLDSDSKNIVDLKEEIRIHSMVVMYHFKDRMVDRDFLYHVRELESKDNSLLAVNLINCDNGSGLSIDEDYYKVEDNIIVISKEYLNSLEEGYYMLRAVMEIGIGEIYESGVVLYISNSDALKEQDMYLQNTTFDYSISSSEKLHIVLNNDSARKIEGLYSSEEEKIDDSMYRIIQEGRVVEISNEFLAQFPVGVRITVFLKGNDGSEIEISINTVE